MPRAREDLTGRRFGWLVVAEYACSANAATYWRCRCDCGRQKVVRAYNLKGGTTRSCGCMREGRRPLQQVHPVVAQLFSMRRDRGQTLAQVAERAGYAYQSIGEAERGVNAPSLALLNCWAEAMGMELALKEKRND